MIYGNISERLARDDEFFVRRNDKNFGAGAGAGGAGTSSLTFDDTVANNSSSQSFSVSGTTTANGAVRNAVSPSLS